MKLIIVGIAFCMMYLHYHGIVNLNLKPDNILLDEYFNSLISKFNLRRVIFITIIQLHFQLQNSFPIQRKSRCFILFEIKTNDRS